MAGEPVVDFFEELLAAFVDVGAKCRLVAGVDTGFDGEAFEPLWTTVVREVVTQRVGVIIKVSPEEADGALVDRSGRHDLAELRSLQDWFLKFELQTVPGVSEVATIGGMVKQYQVVIDPDKLRAFGLTLANVKSAIQLGNQETGGSVIEMGEAEYMVRATGYLQGIDDLEAIPLGVNAQGTPLILSDVADIRIGPQLRRGIAELDGEGEVVGGVRSRAGPASASTRSWSWR